MTKGDGATAPVERPSPNQGPRRGGARADMVVLHYTGMSDCAGALDRLCDPSAEVSAHYVVDLNGRIFALVPESARAWHAGVAAWGAVTDVNSRSIGIEIVNPGHELGHPPFPEPQMLAVERLLAGILERHAIAPERVVGHACVAPGRKRDPGEKFDWRRLARAGLSVWLDADDTAQPDGPADPAAFRDAARRFGYPVGEGAGWDDALRAVWASFAMRFRPADAARGALPGRAALRHLERLAASWPVAPERASSISAD
ncbi:N-acetylmuramoyl-L-alanine amidase [Limibaculum sp. M0105]|uniref:N-acetylmuramoyl-L-alanine amidase n=1 Tax=Thermohalobaculum xanthum TaxID=2753746 RepID=A0A8J7M6T8_9RHOB|nr:N-acetylmuramoyl-L-alanine amidase [Thermohalobaculum xanthum]MBK0399656.1 N-acetylmuramoyl-L-alanine amidase [Thermohalobaculum xanthum]